MIATDRRLLLGQVPLMVVLAGCSSPDLTVVGYEFHLSTAVVAVGTVENGFEGLYWFEITNFEHPCDWRTEPEPGVVDEFRIHITNYGGLAVEGPPHPDFEGISLWISEGASDGIRTFMTSGGEVVERDGTRLRLVFDLTHEGFTIGDPMYWRMDEPIHIDLDLPYTTCED